MMVVPPKTQWWVRALQLPIRAYQLLLSPMLGSNCRYFPSCSAYALQALEEHGALRGSYLAAHRMCRCGPWGKGGVDEVPARTARHVFSSLVRPATRSAGSRPAEHDLSSF
jgi:uncharacterized protein